jgi:hypothetical protein
MEGGEGATMSSDSQIVPDSVPLIASSAAMLALLEAADRAAPSAARF